jgi:hypothetical protein
MILRYRISSPNPFSHDCKLIYTSNDGHVSIAVVLGSHGTIPLGIDKPQRLEGARKGTGLQHSFEEIDYDRTVLFWLELLDANRSGCDLIGSHVYQQLPHGGGGGCGVIFSRQWFNGGVYWVSRLMLNMSHI